MDKTIILRVNALLILEKPDTVVLAPCLVLVGMACTRTSGKIGGVVSILRWQSNSSYFSWTLSHSHHGKRK